MAMALSAGTSPVHRAVATWLFTVALLLVAMILVGGLTRLTDSGLAIVEWRPVTGLIPPIGEAAWQAELAKYRQCAPEYAAQNRGMSLSEFQTIYWWEWGHRALGRLIGLVYAVPLALFLWWGMVPRALRARLLVILGLGGLQAVIGWWMVQSGLAAELRDCLAAAAAAAPVPEVGAGAPLDVRATRLALHLGLAFVILGAVVWTLRDLGASPRQVVPPGLRLAAFGVLGLVFVQILLGALVAGTDAGLVYTTWPLMDGRFVPEGLFILEPWIDNFTQNVTLIQFQHRIGAYLVAIAVFLLWIAVWRSVPYGTLHRKANALLAHVALQIGVGIWTLVAAAPLGLSALHQAIAIAVFVSSVLLAAETRSPASQAASA